MPVLDFALFFIIAIICIVNVVLAKKIVTDILVIFKVNGL